MVSVSEYDPYPRRRLAVKDSEMSFVDTGSGQPVIFLHGNPTSSYIWRNIIPHVAPLARCLAPDLIGMGDSGKNPHGGYQLADQIAYLDDWFDQLALSNRITLVMQDWGVGLGFDWARRHPQRVRGMVHMEGIIRPMRWEEWPQRTREFVARLKSPEGEKLGLEENAIVEKFLPLGTARTFSEVRELCL